MTVKQAALISGGSEEWVRSACRRGILGDSWSGKEEPLRKAYVVSPKKLADWLGISVEEIEKKIEMENLK